MDDAKRKPIPKDWAWLDEVTGPFDEDFVAAANEQPEAQERPALDALFSQ